MDRIMLPFFASIIQRPRNVNEGVHLHDELTVHVGLSNIGCDVLSVVELVKKSSIVLTGLNGVFICSSASCSISNMILPYLQYRCANTSLCIVSV
eukprot:15364625-Ditylum_brightwellii.AAC.2